MPILDCEAIYLLYHWLYNLLAHVDCIHRMLYGFHFVTPQPLPQCVARLHHYHSKKNIIASLLKFAGYIHNNKILPGNTFGLNLKNKMAARDVYLTLSKDFCWPCRAKGIIGRDLKFAGYVPLLKNLDWEYLWPHFEKQDGCHRHFFVSHKKCLCLPCYWS